MVVWYIVLHLFCIYSLCYMKFISPVKYVFYDYYYYYYYYCYYYCYYYYRYEEQSINSFVAVLKLS